MTSLPDIPRPFRGGVSVGRPVKSLPVSLTGTTDTTAGSRSGPSTIHNHWDSHTTDIQPRSVTIHLRKRVSLRNSLGGQRTQDLTMFQTTVKVVEFLVSLFRSLSISLCAPNPSSVYCPTHSHRCYPNRVGLSLRVNRRMVDLVYDLEETQVKEETVTIKRGGPSKLVFMGSVSQTFTTDDTYSTVRFHWFFFPQSQPRVQRVEGQTTKRTEWRDTKVQPTHRVSI